jgi:outer membrane protein
MNKIIFLFLLLLAPCVYSQTNDLVDTDKPRNISMMEALNLALKNNLDIRISQSTPLLDEFGLKGLYGAYEPNYSFGATYNNNSSFGGVDSQGRSFGQNSQEAEVYSSGISGVLPTGLNYDLGGTLSKQTTINPFSYTLINTNIPPFSTNTFFGTARQGPYYISGPGITLRQPILRNFWIDYTRLQISLAKKNLRIDQLALRLQIMAVVNNVKAAYYNLIFARENVKVNVSAVELAERLTAENKKKVELGSLAPLEEKQAESQLATSKADLFESEKTLALQENVLKSLISDNYNEWAGTKPVPTEDLIALPAMLNLQESLRRGIELRPDLAEAKLIVEKQNITIKYTRNQLFPEVDLTGSYGRNATTFGLESNADTLDHGAYPYYSYGITMTIPLGNRTARNNHKAAKETLAQLMLQLKKTERAIVINIENDVKIARANLLRVRATQEASGYANSALQAEQQKFDAGKSTSFFVLQFQSTLTSARSSEIRALADYNISLEQLAYDEGSILERNRIDVNLK